MAEVVATAPLGDVDTRGVQLQLVVASAAAVLVLIVTTTLSIYKPRGLTPYGSRKRDERRSVF